MTSLSVLVIASAASSATEFKEGRWLEGCAELAMAAVRAHQFVPQVRQLRKKWEIEKAVQRVYVGTLREKWQFPSDHLPVGVQVGKVRMISWNVLNNTYINWVIEKDSQGLIPIIKNNLTFQLRQSCRDSTIVKRVKSDASLPGNNRNLI